MSRTFRKIPKKKWIRTPKYKHKFFTGESIKHIVTDWDDKPIAAIKEQDFQKS